MGTGPVVVGYDGSPASERALREAGDLFASSPLLVVVVWEPGQAFTSFPSAMPTAPIDIRVSTEVDEAMYERARHLAEEGAAVVRAMGRVAEGLAVADRLTVPATLVRLAEERDAAAIVLGSHGHNALRQLLLGSTTREVIRRAPCPVVVTRERPDDDAGA